MFQKSLKKIEEEIDSNYFNLDFKFFISLRLFVLKITLIDRYDYHDSNYHDSDYQSD